ncbi:MAG: hypothetical protein O3A47_11135 [Chloroflexi bacterium]|nr:hypothetical protein [Chloroflexota bacterium]
MENRSNRQIRTLIRLVSTLSGVALSILTFIGYLKFSQWQEQRVVESLTDQLHSNAHHLAVLRPSALELQYQGQMLWMYCMLPGRPEVSETRRRTGLAVSGMLDLQKAHMQRVKPSASNNDLLSRSWSNTRRRLRFVRLMARLKFQEENALLVHESAERLLVSRPNTAGVLL